MLGRFQSTSQNRENQISRYLTVQSRIEILMDLNSKVSRGTNSEWDFVWIWTCSWLKSPQHSGFRLPFNLAFRVSSSTERAVQCIILTIKHYGMHLHNIYHIRHDFDRDVLKLHCVMYAKAIENVTMYNLDDQTLWNAFTQYISYTSWFWSWCFTVNCRQGSTDFWHYFYKISI